MRQYARTDTANIIQVDVFATLMPPPDQNFTPPWAYIDFISSHFSLLCWTMTTYRDHRTVLLTIITSRGLTGLPEETEGPARKSSALCLRFPSRSRLLKGESNT
jgi:hypothetical protein